MKTTLNWLSSKYGDPGGSAMGHNLPTTARSSISFVSLDICWGLGLPRRQGGLGTIQAGISCHL